MVYFGLLLPRLVGEMVLALVNMYGVRVWMHIVSESGLAGKGRAADQLIHEEGLKW